MNVNNIDMIYTDILLYTHTSIHTFVLQVCCVCENKLIYFYTKWQEKKTNKKKNVKKNKNNYNF